MSVVRPMSRLGTLAFKVPIKVPALGTVLRGTQHKKLGKLRVSQDNASLLSHCDGWCAKAKLQHNPKRRESSPTENAAAPTRHSLVAQYGNTDTDTDTNTDTDMEGLIRAAKNLPEARTCRNEPRTLALCIKHT